MAMTTPRQAMDVLDGPPRNDQQAQRVLQQLHSARILGEAAALQRRGRRVRPRRRRQDDGRPPAARPRTGDAATPLIRS